MMNIEGLEQIAKTIIEKNGHHSPQIIFVTKKGIEIALLIFDSEEAKEIMLDVVRRKVSTEKIDKYFTIMEGWIGRNLNVRPSLDSQRQEGIIISEYNRDMKNKTLIHKFERKNNKIKWTERVILGSETDSCSIWNVFVEDCMEERIAKARIKAFQNGNV
jgi:hypothetical protein